MADVYQATDVRPFLLSQPQLLMLRALARWCEHEQRKHGDEHGWVELGQLVMGDAMSGPDHIAWGNSNRVFGALERKRLIEHHPTADDLIRPSATGYAVLKAREATSHD